MPRSLPWLADRRAAGSSRARVWYIVFGAILVRSGIHAAAHRYRYVQGGERRLVRLRWKVTPWAAVRAGPVQFCEIYTHTVI